MSKSLTIHGVSYIFNPTHSKFTRVFWTFSFLLSICGFCFYLHTSYVKTFINPDFGMKINQKLSREIPFPAITVCSPLFTRDKIVDIREYFKIALRNEKFAANLSESQCEYFSANNHWCFANYARFSTCEDDSRKIVEFLQKSSVKVSEFIVACTFGLNFYDPTEMFQKVLTDGHGFCYTYNVQDFEVIFKEEISEEFKFIREEIKVSEF